MSAHYTLGSAIREAQRMLQRWPTLKPRAILKCGEEYEVLAVLPDDAVGIVFGDGARVVGIIRRAPRPEEGSP